MTLQYPFFLWGLVLLAPLALLQFRSYYRGAETIKRMYGGSIPGGMAAIFYIKSFFSSLFLMAAVVFLLLAMSGIGWGSSPVEDDREGAEAIFVVDISSSMLARDIQPSRMERAIELMRGVIQALPEMRFGVTAFKGEGEMFVPVTENRYAFDFLEQSLIPSSISAPWSHIDAGLRAGLENFPDGSSRNQVLVLLSDGENHGRNPLPFAAELGRKGVPVVALTLGTVDGATIPSAETGQAMRDAKDQVIVTRAWPQRMAKIAEMSGGLAISASDPGALGRIITFLEEQEDQGTGYRLVEIERYRLFIILGLLMLVLRELTRIIRWKGVL